MHAPSRGVRFCSPDRAGEIGTEGRCRPRPSRRSNPRGPASTGSLPDPLDLAHPQRRRPFWKLYRAARSRSARFPGEVYGSRSRRQLHRLAPAQFRSVRGRAHRTSTHRIAALDANRLLRLTGLFPTRPLQINFDLVFAVVNGRWSLDGISVATPEAPPQAQASQQPASAPPSAARKPAPKPQ